MSSKSHPLIHPAKQHTVLPQAALEEEVEETPLQAMENGQNLSGQASKNTSRLVYEITSDDGYHIQAESWHGMLHILYLLYHFMCSHYYEGQFYYGQFDITVALYNMFYYTRKLVIIRGSKFLQRLMLLATGELLGKMKVLKILKYLRFS